MNDEIKLIALTNGGSAIVDAHRFEELNRFRWQHKDGYAVRYSGTGRKQKRIWMHRVVHGTPEGLETDHENRNRLDNRECNLRTATDAQTAYNAGKRSDGVTSRFKGVSRRNETGRWRADISVNCRRISLGLFDEEIQAAIAYNRAARKYHQEFAGLNDVDESLWNPDSRRQAKRAIYPGVRQLGNRWQWRISRKDVKASGRASNPESAAWLRDRYIIDHKLDLPLTFPPIETFPLVEELEQAV